MSSRIVTPIIVHEYTIFYCVDPTPQMVEGVNPPKYLGEFHSKWREVTKINAESLDDVFAMMQGESWSPTGEARSHIERLGLTHTSMSAGDIVRDYLGNYYICEHVGWTRFNLIPEVYGL